MPSQVRRFVALAAASSVTIVIVAACVGDEPTTGNSPGNDGGPGGPDSTSSNDGGSDGGSDTSVPTDAPVDSPAEAAAPACDVTKAFGMPPSRLEDIVVNQADVDDNARISANGLELYLARQTNGADPRQIVRYTRATPTSTWVLDRAISVLSTRDAGNFAATGFTLMPDGLSAFYQYYYSGGNSGIWSTTRPSLASSDWSAPAKIPGMSSDQALGRFGPFLSVDGKHVYFQSPESGNGDHAHHMDVADGGVSNIARVNITLADGGAAPANEFAPIVTGDLLTMYFGYYTNSVPGGVLQRYIFKATRTSTSADFSNAEYVPELFLSGGFAQPTWVSADGCTMLFTSTRAPGGVHVWIAKKPL